MHPPVKLPLVVLPTVSIKHRAYIYPRYLSPRYDRSDNLFRLSQPSPSPSSLPVDSATLSFIRNSPPPRLNIRVEMIFRRLFSLFAEFRPLKPTLSTVEAMVGWRHRDQGERVKKNGCHAPIKQAISRCPGAKEVPGYPTGGPDSRCASQGILLPDHRACIALRG